METHVPAKAEAHGTDGVVNTYDHPDQSLGVTPQHGFVRHPLRAAAGTRRVWRWLVSFARERRRTRLRDFETHSTKKCNSAFWTDTPGPRHRLKLPRLNQAALIAVELENRYIGYFRRAGRRSRACEVGRTDRAGDRPCSCVRSCGGRGLPE
jgi:hypothetical protein